MPRIIRTLALSGAAAAAVLTTTATASAASAEESVSVVQAAADRAAGTPVTLPSGTVLHIRGLDAAAYRASADHRQAVVQFAADTTPGTGAVNPGGTSGIDTSLTPQGQQKPGIGQNVGYNPQQVTTQAGAGAIGGTAVSALVLGIIVWVLIKKSGLKVSYAITCVAFGVLLSPTFVGPLVGQLTGSGISAFGNL